MGFPPALVTSALYAAMLGLFCCTTAAADEQFAGPPSADSVPDPRLNRLLEMLDARRALCGEGGFRWRFTSERFTVPMPSVDDYQAELERRALNPLDGATKDEKQRFEGHVLWQPSTNRFHFSASFVQKWIGGAADYLAEREQIGFDGEAFWHVETARPGTELPQEDFTEIRDPSVDWEPSATIGTAVPAAGRIEHLAAENGFIFRPGYMSFPYGREWGKSVDIAGFFTELVRRGKTLTVQEDADLVHVSFPVQAKDQPERTGTMRLTFNMAQLGAIERITYFGDGPGGKQFRNADYSIRNAEVSPGVWFPQEIIWGDWMNMDRIRVEISDLQIVKSCRTADFQVDFPVGTNITDHRNQTFSVASKDMWDEARATREYAMRYLGERPSPRSRKSSLFWTLIVGNTILILVLVRLCCFRRHWARNRGVRALIVVGLLVAGAATYTLIRLDVSGGGPGSVPLVSFPAATEITPLGTVDPDWSMQSLDGHRVSFAELRGKTVFVNFWATWCLPCVAEMPSIQALYESLADEGIAFVAISEEPASTVAEFVEENGYTFPIYTTEDSAPAVFETNRLPATFIVNSQGEVVFRYVGMADWNTEECRRILREVR